MYLYEYEENVCMVGYLYDYEEDVYMVGYEEDVYMIGYLYEYEEDVYMVGYVQLGQAGHHGQNLPTDLLTQVQGQAGLVYLPNIV